MLYLPNCKFCNRECKSPNSLRNHERLCRQNPNRDTASTDLARKNAAKPTLCTNCNEYFPKSNIRRHEKTCALKDKVCAHCAAEFRATSSKDQKYCGNKCANNATKYKPRKDNRYTTICFQHHGKKCIICGEEKIVAVHHFNEDHFDDRPENLVPLCPTHHQYMHSRYKVEILDRVKDFINKFCAP